jgi:uncharacterized glyoxalase superfamily protein PhnB
VIEFLQKAFDAKQTHPATSRPDGTIMHAEVKIGDSHVMMGEPMGDTAPIPGSLYLYVEDVDATYRRAMSAGGISLMEPADQFYGDRNAGVKDQAGNTWWIGTHIEDVSPEELAKRAAARGQAPHS